MFLNLLFLSVTLSIDSLGVGISYGVRNIKILNRSKLVLFMISFIIVLLSSFSGFIFRQFLPMFIKNIIRWNYTYCYGNMDNISSHQLK